MKELAAIKGGHETEDEYEEESSPIWGGQQIIHTGGEIPQNLPQGAIIIRVPADGKAQNPNPSFEPYGNKQNYQQMAKIKTRISS